MAYQPTIYDQANLAQQTNGGALILDAMARNRAIEEEKRRSVDHLNNQLALQRDASAGHLTNILAAQTRDQTFKAVEGEKDRDNRLKIARAQIEGYVDKLSTKAKEDRLLALAKYNVVDNTIEDLTARLIDAEKKLGPVGAKIIKEMDGQIQTAKSEIDKRVRDAALTQAKIAFPNGDFLPGELEKIKPFLGQGKTPEQAINLAGLKANRKASLLSDYNNLVSQFTLLAPKLDPEIGVLNHRIDLYTGKRQEFIDRDEAGRAGFTSMFVDNPAEVRPLGPPASLAPAVNYGAIRARADAAAAAPAAAPGVSTPSDVAAPPATAAEPSVSDQAMAYIRANRQYAPGGTFTPVRTQVGNRFPQTGETVADPRQALTSIASNLDQRAAGTRPGSQYRTELSGRAAQARALVTQLWGNDAPELLPKLADLANQHGVPQQVQTNVFEKAMAGDPDAISNIGRDLNFLRQQSTGDISDSTTNFSDPRLAPPNLPGRGALPREPIAPGVYGPRY